MYIGYGEWAERARSAVQATIDPNPIDQVAAVYGPRALTLLAEVRDYFDTLGIPTGEPFDMSDDVYRWSLAVGDASLGLDELIDVTVEIAEAQAYGDDPADGVNFGLSISRYGGELLADCQPFNFSPQCWVPASDPEAVRERWDLFADAARDVPVDVIPGEL
jgi:hypothetical protein